MILALRQSLNLVGSHVLVSHLSIFLHATEAVQGASIIEETKTHIEFCFSELWKSLPLVLRYDVSFAASGSFVLTHAAARDENLGKVGVNCASE